jgi:hypothetical protein
MLGREIRVEFLKKSHMKIEINILINRHDITEILLKVALIPKPLY